MKDLLHPEIFRPVFLVALLFVVYQTIAQSPPYYEQEKSSDPYIYVDPRSYQTSPAYFYQNELITTYQVNVNPQGQNKLGDAANEPSLAIDPINPLRMAIGWRQFNTIISNFRQAGYAFSINGGMNWTNQGNIEPGSFRSDPVLDTDANGRFYYNSLTNVAGQIVNDVFRSEDNFEWDGGVPAHGGDKQWMVIDKTENPSKGNIYAVWNLSFTSCHGDFIYSFDGGETYSECNLLDQTIAGGTINIGPDGTLFGVGGYEGIYFGSASEVLEEDAPLEWDFFEDISPAMVPGFGGPNPEGILGQTWVDSDHSNGPNHGNIYVTATMAYTDMSDIVFFRSLDGGHTWDTPKIINRDEQGNYNWFGTMSVAPNGRIDIVWLDTRDTPGSHNSALYYSYSEDGGETFSPDVRLSEIFDPHVGYPNQEKMGDYFHMRSDNEGANLAWAATFNGEQDVYFSRISFNEISSVDEGVTHSSISDFLTQPNPFYSAATISFENINAGFISLEIFDLLGNKLSTLLKGHYLAGKQNVSWNGTDENGNQVPGGIYFSKLSIDGTAVKTDRLILIR